MSEEAQDQLSENVVVEDVVNDLMRYIRRRVQQDMAAIVIHVRRLHAEIERVDGEKYNRELLDAQQRAERAEREIERLRKQVG